MADHTFDTPSARRIIRMVQDVEAMPRPAGKRLRGLPGRGGKSERDDNLKVTGTTPVTENGVKYWSVGRLANTGGAFEVGADEAWLFHFDQTKDLQHRCLYHGRRYSSAYPVGGVTRPIYGTVDCTCACVDDGGGVPGDRVQTGCLGCTGLFPATLFLTLRFGNFAGFPQPQGCANVIVGYRFDYAGLTPYGAFTWLGPEQPCENGETWRPFIICTAPFGGGVAGLALGSTASPFCSSNDVGGACYRAWTSFGLGDVFSVPVQSCTPFVASTDLSIGIGPNFVANFTITE